MMGLNQSLRIPQEVLCLDLSHSSSMKRRCSLAPHRFLNYRMGKATVLWDQNSEFVKEWAARAGKEVFEIQRSAS